jgi:hypothetical protein
MLSRSHSQCPASPLEAIGLIQQVDMLPHAFVLAR